MLASNTILCNRYRIVQQLGRGGMGAVYQAMDDNLSCLVAVKETFATTEEQRHAFEREAKLLANLSHPALPRVMDHFSEGEGQFLVMQFIPGNDLAELLAFRESPFDAARVLEWADYLLDALEELHSYKPPIIHRDIKPSNLKLTPRGRIILLDFGIAKGAAGQMTTVETDGSLGAYTPNYAPLEQAVRSDRRWADVLSISNEDAVKEILQRGTDPRSDLYALAATLYHLVTGEIPPDAPTRALTVWSGKPDRLRRANDVNPRVPVDLADILQKGMALHRDQRPASAADMRRMLRATIYPQPPAEKDEVAKMRAMEEAQQRAEAEAARRAAIEEQQRKEEDRKRREAEEQQGRQAAAEAETRRQQESSNATAKQASPAKTIPAPFTPARLPSPDNLAPSASHIGPTAPQNRLWLKTAVGVSLLILAAALVAGVLLMYWQGLTVNDNASATADPNIGETAGTKYTPTGNEGTVSGTVSYRGLAPEPKKIDTAADQACTLKNPNLTTEEWVVRDGKLANTFVYIKDGIANGQKISEYTWPVPTTSALLDQNGCHYKPHVLGVMVNQEISITNSDPTTHNVHFTPKNNPDWNQSQLNGAAPMTHKLNYAEVLVPVKCNQHPWMKSYIAVLKHPFFAVTSEDGRFTIKGVPPGTYTVAAWHEGGTNGTEKVVQVTVSANGAATANFSFGGFAAMRGQPSSLQILPAIEFSMSGKH
jgi:serine/threonine protein kinase/plastocyanin